MYPVLHALMTGFVGLELIAMFIVAVKSLMRWPSASCASDARTHAALLQSRNEGARLAQRARIAVRYGAR